MPSKSLPGVTAKEGDINGEDKENIKAVGNGNIKSDTNQNGK
jgi:hypothetical protein